jgi:1,4-dihydroxy-6-naphthoate synthase
MQLTLGFSPCPNDTFIFDALVNNKIDTEGIELKVVLEDVQTLNQWAIEGKLDITKLSYGVLPLVLNEYLVLNSGSALGNGVGPLLITNSELADTNIDDATIAIPGGHTTAHLLFSLAYPHVKNKVFLRYDSIENYVLEGKGPGVIIHENRFTYQDKGLKKIVDLGDYWEAKTGNPIPLGGIVIKRNINIEIQQKIDRLIRKSIEFAFSKYPELNDYIRIHSQEMSEEVMRKHIDLYVNNFSINLGKQGKDAIVTLLKNHQSFNQKMVMEDIFIAN